ncbi:MAG: M48 family metallopeptidase [Nitrososphaera sp.]
MSLSLELAKGEALRISVRTSRRSKRLRLVSGIDGVEAVVPVNYSPDELSEFVARKRSWLVRTSKHYRRLKERCGGHEPGTIYLLGSKYHYNVVKDRLPSTIVSDVMKMITFHVVDRRRFRQHLQEWYRRQAGTIIEERLPLLAGTMGLKYNRVSIKNQKSRWASCSRSGNLNFNLLLAAAPPEVIDYVIIHELAHLKELDHSEGFWDLVRAADPEWKKHKEWLSCYAPVIKV